jgi:parallel beta-helix repeat protein
LDGIRFTSSSYNDIVNNNIHSNAENCTVIMSNSYNNTISNNILSDGSCGVYIDNSFNNNVLGNSIFNNYNGIVTGSSLNNIISDNHIHLNNNNGINVSGSYIYLLNNNISNNQNDGIHILPTDWIFVIGNTVSFNNRYGIYLENSADNTIYHNNFIDNANQAYDILDFANQWDNGYPSGGNYWSDFDEPSEGAYDDYHGPDQNISGGDGLVDNGSVQGGGKNPYVIDPGSQDNYPLINPYPYPLFLEEGWNLISVPRIQFDTNLVTVLSSISGSYNAVQWYNTTDLIDPWKHNHTSKVSTLNDLNGVNHKMGFWIFITKPGGVEFQYQGAKPTSNQTIQLYKGWNMVGYPSLSSHNRTTGLNNLTFDIQVDAIQWFDAATKTWHFMEPDDSFVPGRGYWVHSKIDGDWEVPL